MQCASKPKWICVEGPDRVGKSSLVKNLISYLESQEIPVKHMAFPVRTGVTGKMLHDYLTNQGSNPLPDATRGQVLHLTFVANRWEHLPTIQEYLKQGYWVIMDRWSASGVVYSASRGIDFHWAYQAENGLPSPDMTLLLEADPAILATRPGWGEEREENIDMQRRVQENFRKFYTETPNRACRIVLSENTREEDVFIMARNTIFQ